MAPLLVFAELQNICPYLGAFILGRPVLLKSSVVHFALNVLSHDLQALEEVESL
jgi:hypothetical protein